MEPTSTENATTTTTTKNEVANARPMSPSTQTRRKFSKLRKFSGSCITGVSWYSSSVLKETSRQETSGSSARNIASRSEKYLTTVTRSRPMRSAGVRLSILSILLMLVPLHMRAAAAAFFFFFTGAASSTPSLST